LKQRPAKAKPARRDPAAATLTPGRRWLFRLLAMLLPVSAVLVIELCLRLAGYGYSTAFFKEVRDGERTFVVDNERFSRRFFPPELARWPSSFRFEAKKPPALRRIFILGESAAMGDPQPAFGAGRYLEVLLRERFPGQRFEVINLGITAINSHVILPIARECAQQDGDLWIIYMGNNEMVGPFGAATVFGSRAPPLALVRLYLAIQRTRVGQVFVAGWRKFGGKPEHATWGGMRMFLRNQIPLDDPRRETVYRNFERNLRDIVRIGLDSGAKVLLNTISVNLLDCPPFASMSDSNLPAADRAQFDRLYAEGLSVDKTGAFSAAVARFEAAARIDPQFAELQFRWATCLLRLTNVAAREHFQLACDVDALPFRADTGVNSAIRTLGRQLGASNLVLCDAEGELAKASRNGVAGDESFFEHVHFNFEGNYRLGLAWAERVAQSLALPPNSSSAWASQATCEEHLGLTDWNRLFVIQSVTRRMGQPPFSSQFNNVERVQAVRAQEAKLLQQNAQPGAREKAQTILGAAIRRAPDDNFLSEGLANFLEAIGDAKGAVAAYRRITESMPHDFYACLQLGRLLGEHGQRKEAQGLLTRATQLRPSLPEPWYELGVVVASGSRYAEALDCFERAVQLRPQDGTYLAYKAKTLSRLHRRAEAIQIYREAIQMRRGGWEAHFELAGELAAAGEVAESIREYAEVLRLNPRHAVSHVNLGVMLVRQNRLNEAIQQFEDALRIDPQYKEAQEYLDRVRSRRAQKP